MNPDRSIRTSDLLRGGNGKISIGKVVALILGLLAFLLPIVGAAAVIAWRVNAQEACFREIEAIQKTDHDTLIEMKTSVRQIQLEQREMREDVKEILRHVDHNDGG